VSGELAATNRCLSRCQQTVSLAKFVRLRAGRDVSPARSNYDERVRRSAVDTGSGADAGQVDELLSRRIARPREVGSHGPCQV